MRRASNNRRFAQLAAVLVCAVLSLAHASLASAQETFGDINGDGKVSVTDVGFAQLFALGRLTPTAAQIDTANVFPMLSPTGCGPMGDAACINFATRDDGGDGPGPDAGDITVADVGIIQLVALGRIKMPPRLGISSIASVPGQPRLDGMSSTAMPVSFEINGSGFQTQNVRITLTFAEDAETIACTVVESPSFPITCTDDNAGCNGEIQIQSAGDLATNLIRISAPEVFCHDTSPVDNTVSAEIKVENLDPALQPLGEAVGPEPVVWADSAFELSIVSGNGQGGFPLIPLSNPLVVRAGDLVGNPVTSLATGMMIEFMVTSNQGASLNGEGEIFVADLDAQGVASVNVTPFPPPAGGGDLVIEATLVDLFGETQVTGGPAVFTTEIAESGELLLRPVSVDELLCAGGEVCPDNDAPAQLIGVELIDQYGERVPTNVTFQFTETGASANVSGAGILPSATCMSGSPCTLGGGFAEVGLMAGTLDPGENLGSHTVTATVSGAPGTVLPGAGVPFELEVQRPVGTDLQLVSPALQQERSISRADVPTPCEDEAMAPAACALDVVVFDQFGRAINGEEVTFEVTRSIQSADVLNPGGTQTIMLSTATSEMMGGRAGATLALSGTGAGGQIDVRAGIAAAADLHDGDSELFLFAVGAANPPPPPVKLSRVQVAAPVNNAISTFHDGTDATDLIIRGALGSVERTPGDDITQYRVQLTVGGGAPLETIVTRGLPTGLGSGTDDDFGRFQFQLGSYQPGAVATLRVADAALGNSPDTSLARSFILPGVPSGGRLTGFATDRTQSKVRPFEVDPTDVPGTFKEIDSNTTLGIQGIRISGRGANDIVYFDTDPMSEGVDRALVLNQESKDISVVRIAEEILIQGNDLELMSDPGAIVTSAGANFRYGKFNGMDGTGRNYNCNPGVGTNFVHNQDDDCSVGPGDKLVIDPEGAALTRTIVEVIDTRTLLLAGELTSQRLPPGGVDFRVVSAYREIDADSDPLTTSDDAETGISRIALPTPDPMITMGRDEEHPQSIALWRPATGTITGVEARAYITERAYKGLYVMDLVENGDGQWSFEFPDTGVTDNPGFFPLASQRVMNPVSFTANALTGPGDIAIKQGTAPDYGDALALVVIETQITAGTAQGTVSVVALAPDPTPAGATDLDALLDTAVRFPTQHAMSGRPDSAICEGSFPGFVGCEVDLDHDLTTGTRASPATKLDPTYFDCDNNGTADDVNNSPFPNVTDRFFVNQPVSTVVGGVSALTGRTTGLPGDWRSQEPEEPVGDHVNFTTAGICAGNANPDGLWAYRTDANLSFISKDFSPYRVEVPEGLGVGIRDDVALLSVRGIEALSSATVNREWQPAYLMDIGVGELPVLANAGMSGGINLAVSATPAANPYPIACVADLPHPATTFVGAEPNQRHPDNLISYPRAGDVAITVFNGAPGGGVTHSVWGPDATADTADDEVFPGDILVAKFASEDHIYHFPVTGVDTSSNNTFYIRTDRCDYIPAGPLTEFRVMRTAKLIDLGPLSDMQSPSHRDIPFGLNFQSIRVARGAASSREALKDLALGDDGVDATGFVSFSTGEASDPAGTTHVGAFDLLACLDATVTRESLSAGGCAELTSEQSNDPDSPTPLHLESPDGPGAVHVEATGEFGYLLHPGTGEVLIFAPTLTGSSPELIATLYPSLGVLGGGGFGASESRLSSVTGEISRFSSRRLGEPSAGDRVMVVSPNGQLTVIEEVDLSGQIVPRYDDTDDISGFSAIDYPISLVPSTGQIDELLDGLVVGDHSSSFMGETYGFVLPGLVGRTLSASLGLINFTQRAPVDFDPDTREIDGLDTGGNSFVAHDFDPGRQQLFGILQTGNTDNYVLRAWDLTTREEIDLTTEVQGVTCQSSGGGARLSFRASESNGAVPTSMAVRDGLVLIGFFNGGPQMAAVDTDNLLAGQFIAGLGCDLDIEDAAVLVQLDPGSPDEIQDVAIQGDLAFAAGSDTPSSHGLAVLDLVPFWRDRGCGSFSCLPRDLRAVQPGFVPDAPANAPVNLELHGNLLFVSTDRTGGDGVEVFDVTPYNYGFAAPADGSQSDSILYHAPEKVAQLPGSLNVGGCAGRLSVGGDSLFVTDGRLRFEVAAGSPGNCDRSLLCPTGDPTEANVYSIDLSTPAFNRSSPPDLGVSCQLLGEPASEIRDIIFLPPDPLP